MIPIEDGNMNQPSEPGRWDGDVIPVEAGNMNQPSEPNQWDGDVIQIEDGNMNQPSEPTRDVIPIEDGSINLHTSMQYGLDGIIAIILHHMFRPAV